MNLWERYERYSSDLQKSLNDSEDVQRINWLNLINFIENICYIYNHTLSDKRVAYNIMNLATDFFALFSLEGSLEKVLANYSLDSTSYEEIKKFTKDHDEIIARRMRKAKGTAFDTSQKQS